MCAKTSLNRLLRLSSLRRCLLKHCNALGVEFKETSGAGLSDQFFPLHEQLRTHRVGAVDFEGDLGRADRDADEADEVAGRDAFGCSLGQPSRGG